MPLPFTVRRTDPDAAAFCARSGASDRAAVSAFVRGVKDLGLWESMVCWPLRSEQNAGTGTTAYSLGGLGTFDGMLVDGPTWGANGVNFADNTAQHIATSFIPDRASNFVIWAAIQCNTVGSTVNAICGSRPSGGGQYFTCAQESSGWTRGILWASGTSAVADIAAITNGSYNSAAFRFDVVSSPPLVGVVLNTSAEVTSTTTTALIPNPPDPLILGAENATNLRALSGNLPFLAYIRANSINNVALRDLYKSTLGTGLALP
jgi:hypothetical protein